MPDLKFLCDEDTHPALVQALRGEAVTADALRVGEPGAPPLGTLDPDLLLWAEAAGRVLVSGDRSTMPGHLVAHFTAGHHTAGVILLRRGSPLRIYFQAIVNEVTVTPPDNWTDRTVYLP